MIDRLMKVEGDVNLTEIRKEWIAGLPSETIEMLDNDTSWFLHQSLSTPCLEILSACEGAYIITSSGREILDFHSAHL